MSVYYILLNNSHKQGIVVVQIKQKSQQEKQKSTGNL